MEENAWYGTFMVCGSFPRGRAEKLWHTLIKNDLKQGKVSMNLATNIFF